MSTGDAAHDLMSEQVAFEIKLAAMLALAFLVLRGDDLATPTMGVRVSLPIVS